MPVSSDLARRLAAGDRQALADVYDAHASAVYSLALRITRVPSDAEDVTQEVFTQAWRQAARFDDARGNLPAWLLMMARSRSLDCLRRSRRRPVHPLDPLAADAIPDGSPGVDVVAVTTEQARRTRAALSALPDEQRQPVELAYFEGLTHSEIAVRTSTPLGTVKTRIRSAMQQLRVALTREDA